MVSIIKVLRVLNGDTQQDLANFLGCSPNAISQKETRKIVFSLKEAGLIAKRYNVSLEFLINEEESVRKILAATH